MPPVEAARLFVERRAFAPIPLATPSSPQSGGCHDEDTLYLGRDPYRFPRRAGTGADGRLDEGRKLGRRQQLAVQPRQDVVRRPDEVDQVPGDDARRTGPGKAMHAPQISEE